MLPPTSSRSRRGASPPRPPPSPTTTRNPAPPETTPRGAPAEEGGIGRLQGRDAKSACGSVLHRSSACVVLRAKTAATCSMLGDAD